MWGKVYLLEAVLRAMDLAALRWDLSDFAHIYI